MSKGKEIGAYTDYTRLFEMIEENIQKAGLKDKRDYLKNYISLLDAVEELIYIVDYETRELLYANKSIKNRFDIKGSFGVSKTCYDAIFGKTEPCDFCTLNEYKQSDDDSFEEYEKQIDGRLYNVKRRVISAFDKKIVVICSRDITENRLLKIRYDDTVDMMTCGYIKCKKDDYWTVVEANDNFYKMIGYTPEEFKEEKLNRFSSLLPEGQSDKIIKVIDKQLEHGNKVKSEYSIIAKDGRIVYVIDQAVFYNEDDGEYFYTTFFDITERKIAETIMEEHYQQELKYRNSMVESVVAFCELNVSTNKVIGWNKNNPEISENIDISLDDALNIMFEKGLSLKTSNYLRDALSKDILVDKYNKGEKKFKLEHYFEFDNDSSDDFWCEIRISLHTNPKTMHLEAFVYFKDVTNEKLLSLAIDKEVADEYDYISFIDAKHNKSIIRNSSAYGKSRVEVCHEYTSDIESYANTIIIDDDREFIKQKFSIDNIIKELENKDVYTFSYREITTIGACRHKKVRFSYFDRHKMFIVSSRKDITDEVERNDRMLVDKLLNLEDNKLKDIVEEYIARKDKLQKELIEKAHVNSRTGLLNLDGFCIEAKKLLYENPDKEYCITIRDINNFKVYNEIYGRNKGDELLRYFAQILNNVVTDLGGICGYLGADDFVACFSTDNSIDNIDRVTDLLETAVKRFTSEYKIIVSAGVYIITDRKMPVTTMCDRAALALNMAKNKNMPSCLYDDGIRDNLIKTQEILNEFHNALKERQFQMYLQPQYNIYTGKIAGAEALARWIHPEKGIVSPAEFIPVLEQNGLIPLLDTYIANEACRLMSLLRHNFKGDMPPSIAINLSRADIYRPDLIIGLDSTRESHQLPPSALRLEITESLYVEQPKIMSSFINRLRNTGYRVEMDDFGSGYSSLNTLKDMDIDMLKLDMKFLSSINTDKGSKIVKSVVTMANMLEIPMLAEGVETKEQVEFLKKVGCKYVQGFYFSKPMPVEDYINLLMSTEFERIG